MRGMRPFTNCDTDNCGADIDPLASSTQVTVTWPDGASETFVGENCADHEEALRAAVTETLTQHLRLESSRRGSPRKPKVIDLDRQPAARHVPPSEEAMEWGTVPIPGGLTAAEARQKIKSGLCFFDDCDYKYGGTNDPASATTSHIRSYHGVSLANLGIGKRGVRVSA